MSAVILGALLGVAGLAVAILIFLKIESRIKNELAVVQNRLKDDTERFVQTANERFVSEQFKSKALLEQNKQSIESQVGTLNKELSRLTTMVQNFENDRLRKFATLDEQLAQAALVSKDLAQATQKLSSVIGNNQLRGQWGQRMAEDILRAAGFEEGIHYLKETSQATVSTRPDYTFLLPNDQKVYMDVKFPLNNYLELVSADDKEKQDRCSAEFIRDVKNRIRELKKRDYVNIEEETLDYLILFIPNEQIFGFIHRQAPEIMDEALSQKILLTSPYSLYGVLSIIRQAHDNFHFKKSTNDILKLISLFLDDYENFKKRFLDVGDAIDKSKEKYLEVAEKSFKRLDLRIRKLEDFRKGQEGSIGKLEKEEEIVLQ